MVTVYYFRVWSIATGGYVTSARKAIAETIREVKGEVITGTAEEVDETALDDQGFWGPRSAAES
jgi:hypothetical protein